LEFASDPGPGVLLSWAQNRRSPGGEIVVKRVRNTACLVVSVVVGLLVAGCSAGGPADTEFVEACLKEGQSGASQLLDKELGVTRDEFCKCGATLARSSLSADGYRAMILEMQGKGEEASSITSKMSEPEQIASVQVAAEMVEKCGGVK
jgi:hypothetical protein